MKLNRILQISEIIKTKSCFLLGPRLTGKSTLLRTQLPDAPSWNLLNASTYRELASDPTLIRQELLALKSHPTCVVIDEVQLLPELLNEVHLMIEEYGYKFVLTGSSARALRRKGVNLLAGRARTLKFHPFVWPELGSEFDLTRALNFGLMPSVYLSENPNSELSDYAGTYLRQEVAAEGLSRNMPAFSRFLEVAALCNGQQIDFSSLASDSQVKRSTVVGWFEILKDTLLATELPVWNQGTKRKAVSTAKYYLFDLGVVRNLAGRADFSPKGVEFGNAFEHFMFLELQTACDYGRYQSLHYWRTSTQFEVDFILDSQFAIEVKAKTHIAQSDLKGLRALAEEHGKRISIVVCLCEKQLRMDDVWVFPYGEFLKLMWSGELKKLNDKD